MFSFSVKLNTFINLIVSSSLLIPIVTLEYFVTPFQQGFFCHDPSLSYPYHDSTISTYWLYVTGFGVPLITLIAVEAVWRKKSLQKVCSVQYFEIVLDLIIGYGFGAAVSQCLTDIAKYSIGRLRPHFFDVCRPSFDFSLCDGANFNDGHLSNQIYITNYTCNGNEELFPDKDERQNRINDAHLSFVSGHASFSFQWTVFIVLYLQVRNLKRRCLIVPFVQVSLLIFAYFTSLTRVTDYKHHPGDVFAGAVMGIIVQVLNVLYVMKLFYDGERKSTDHRIGNSQNSLPLHCDTVISTVPA